MSIRHEGAINPNSTPANVGFSLDDNAGNKSSNYETIKPNSSSEVKGQLSPRYSITAAEDAAYLDAVRKGDMETAQRMVDEAAENAGYMFRGYHGTPTGEFTVFSTDRVVLTDNEKNCKYININNTAPPKILLILFIIYDLINT